MALDKLAESARTDLNFEYGTNKRISWEVGGYKRERDGEGEKINIYEGKYKPTKWFMLFDTRLITSVVLM